MMKKTVNGNMNKSGLAPSVRLIQTAMNIGFSHDELDELRQVYGFAMDRVENSGSSGAEAKDIGKEAA